MTDTSVIPTPAPPDVCSVSVLIDGTEISGEFHVLSASVSNELNRIPAASVQVRDGEASKQTFEASDTDHFVPGKEIEIKLGYGGETETVFKGIIVKHRVRVRKNGTLLSLECRDKAVRMTSGLKSRYYTDTTDGDILDELFGEYGLDRDVASTKPSLAEVVQYDSTDWDFVVCRAEANGHVVAVRDGKVTVGPPATGAEPVVTAQFGATVLELDAEIDARWQVKGVTAKAWNATDQAARLGRCLRAVGDRQRRPVGVGPVRRDRRRPAPAPPRRQARRARAAGVGRRAAPEGPARQGPRPGALPGVRRRHRGRCHRGRPASASASPASSTWPGVRHTFANGNWETDVAFGLAPETYAATYPVTAQPAGGLLPAVNGLQIGIVTALQDDPDGEDRIKVRLPLVSDSEEGVWARLATLDAGDERGTFFRPEIDDEVVVGFLDGDPRFPVVLGQCHSSAKPAPETAKDDNHVKGYVSRSKMKLTFDDDKKVVILETPGGNKLTLSEDEKTASLVDQNGNKVTLDDGGITLESAKDLTLKASGDVKLEGTNVEFKAQANFKAEGQAGVDVKSSGTLTIKGSLVQIN